MLSCLGTGSTSSVLKGVDLVTADGPKPGVVNVSLGGAASQARDTAVTNSVNAGFFYAVAAGNESTDACHGSPSRLGPMDGLMTVAAIDINEQEAGFSNYGNCVDIWAPGVSILSTKSGGGTHVLLAPRWPPHMWPGQQPCSYPRIQQPPLPRLRRPSKTVLCKRAPRVKMDGELPAFMWVVFSIAVARPEDVKGRHQIAREQRCPMHWGKIARLHRLGGLVLSVGLLVGWLCPLSRLNRGVEMDSERSALNLLLKASKAVYARVSPWRSPCSW